MHHKDELVRVVGVIPTLDLEVTDLITVALASTASATFNVSFWSSWTHLLSR
jgi:hypothetical protein